MDYLSDADRRKALIVLPEPVDDRLESLTRVARAARIQVSRSQLLAALVASAPTDPARLARVMHHYLAQACRSSPRSTPGRTCLRSCTPEPSAGALTGATASAPVLRRLAVNPAPRKSARYGI